MTVFSHPEFHDHEQVVFASDAATGLRAIIAVHNTTMGPAVGGCRMFPYVGDDDAINDVLRLSRGMTYKSALAKVPFGGGKSVIIGDPRHQKTPALMQAMGRAVDRLGGAYVIAEDSGTSPLDMREIGKTTRHVTGVEDNDHGGDPSPATAWGLFIAIKTGVRHKYGSEDLNGLRVAVQGLGNVGYHLARHLTEAGATVLAADIHAPNVERAVEAFGALAVPSDEILAADCDVLAPCALGAILNAHSIPQIKASVIAGAANNQLATDDDDARLAERGILYCPDFAINSGGVIEIHHQHQDSPDSVRKAALAAIGDTLDALLTRAGKAGAPTQAIAIEMAMAVLQAQSDRGSAGLQSAGLQKAG